MKIKLSYPKIPDTLHCPLRQCVAFEKYDGTNIHWVWKPGHAPASGFEAYGTRRDRFTISPDGIKQFNQAHPELEQVIYWWDEPGTMQLLNIFLEKNPKYNSAKEIIFFTEYFGPNSFAGSHRKVDPMQLVLLDVQKDGVLIPPADLINDFSKFNLARVVFQGKFTGQLFVDVRKGKYNVAEGVVVKGMVDNQVYMAKIKTEAYMERLKTKFQDKWKDYWE